jgi:hypothetical protein
MWELVRCTLGCRSGGGGGGGGGGWCAHTLAYYCDFLGHHTTRTSPPPPHQTTTTRTSPHPCTYFTCSEPITHPSPYAPCTALTLSLMARPMSLDLREGSAIPSLNSSSARRYLCGGVCGAWCGGGGRLECLKVVATHAVKEVAARGEQCERWAEGGRVGYTC